MTIHILWATIRSNIFIQMYKLWIKNSNYDNIIFHIAVDNQEDYNSIKPSLKDNDRIIISETDRKGVCYPCYQLASTLDASNNDIIIFASDDIFPPKGWDQYLISKLNIREGCLMVNDGYQELDFSNMYEPVFSIPVMTYSALLKLNKIIYNPIYNHLFSDAELYLNAKELGLIIDERILDKDYIFEHKHWSNNKRQPDINDQGYYNNLGNDLKTWEERKKLSLEERLKTIR